MREERFPWGLGAILVLLIVGGIGFWLGSSSVAPVIVPVTAPVAPAPAPVTPVYPAPAYAPHGGGFPLIPFFFGLIFLVVIFKVIRHAAWGGYQRSGAWSGTGPAGPRGRGSWGGDQGGPRGRHRHGHGWYGPAWNDDVDDSVTQPPMQRTAPEPNSSQETTPAASTASDAASGQARRGWPDGMAKAREFWNSRDVPPMVDEMFQRWHSRMHEASTATESTAPATDEPADGGSLDLPPSDPPTDASA